MLASCLIFRDIKRAYSDGAVRNRAIDAAGTNVPGVGELDSIFEAVIVDFGSASEGPWRAGWENKLQGAGGSRILGNVKADEERNFGVGRGSDVANVAGVPWRD